MTLPRKAHLVKVEHRTENYFITKLVS